MYNFTFENNGTNTYLVYKINDKDKLDTMSLGMLTNNKIPGLAATLFTQMNSSRYIKYNVSAKVSMKQFFTGYVNKKRLLGVFNGIVSALISAEDYMIESGSILLDLDYIFTDVSSCDTVLICLPVVNDDRSAVNIGMFFKNIMFSTKFDQSENCDYVAKIINYLNSAATFSLADFKALLNELQGINSVNSAPAVQQPAAQPAPVQSTAAATAANNASAQKPAYASATVQNSNVSSPFNSAKAVQQTPNARYNQQGAAANAQSPFQQYAMNGNQNSVQQTSAKKTQKQFQQPPRNNSRNNFQQPPAPSQQPPMNNTAANGEKQIGFFGLLMHYSKENAALYKAQKAAKKNKPVAQQQMMNPSQPQTNRKAKMQMNNQAFAVPGAPINNTNFNNSTQSPSATVGQPVSVPAAKPQANAQMQNQAPSLVKPPAKSPFEAYTPNQSSVQNNFQGLSSVNYSNNQPISQHIQQSQSVNFGETTVLTGGSGAGETTVLGGAQQSAGKATPYLVRAKNHEKILINKPVFRIGKERSYVDYFISDNTAVSRSHANIITRGDNYYIVDTNSTNHTFVNGNMINSNSEVKLEHKAVIRIANEEFEFNLY